MSTVLRVKRRIDDGPLDVLVIASKKRKVEESEIHDAKSSDAVTAVVKFAGTVKTQEEDLAHHLTKTLSKEELKANYKKQHIVDITNKLRIKTQKKSKDSRYRIVNFYRSLGGPIIEKIDDNGMTVIDVEDSISCSNNECADDKEHIYVYDLYYTQTEEELKLDDYFSIHPLDQELVFDYNYRNSVNDCDDAGESEDSNSESNWRNEYPDSEHTDGDDSVDEDDMRAAVARLKLDGEESDLSTDTDDFVYTVDENDVDNYGYKYAKYKAKIKEELEEDSDLSDYSGVCITEEPDGDDEEINN